MTALLSRDGTNFSLACDGCGQVVTDLATTMHSWDLAWHLFSQHGWSGAELATGPHACRRCTAAPLPPRMAEEALLRHPREPARPRSRRLTVTTRSGVTVVEVTGELDLTVNAQLHDLLLDRRSPRRHLVVDLSAVRMLDVSALVVLVEAQARLARAGFGVVLVGLSPAVDHALRMLGLRQRFTVAADRAEAIARLTGTAVLPRQRVAQDDPVEAA